MTLILQKYDSNANLLLTIESKIKKNLYLLEKMRYEFLKVSTPEKLHGF